MAVYIYITDVSPLIFSTMDEQHNNRRVAPMSNAQRDVFETETVPESKQTRKGAACMLVPIA